MRYKRQFDSGFDLYAVRLTHIPSHGHAIVETTLSSEGITSAERKRGHKQYEQAGWGLYLWPKSSSNWLVGGGVVDIDYDDTIYVKVFNVTPHGIEIKEGQAVCQGVVQPVYQLVDAEKGPRRHREGGIKSQHEE